MQSWWQKVSPGTKSRKGYRKSKSLGIGGVFSLSRNDRAKKNLERLIGVMHNLLHITETMQWGGGGETRPCRRKRLAVWQHICQSTANEARGQDNIHKVRSERGYERTYVRSNSIRVSVDIRGLQIPPLEAMANGVPVLVSGASLGSR